MRIRSLFAAIAFVAALGAAIPASAQFPPPELAIHNVRDGIYLIQSGGSGNITAFIGDDSVLFVDSKFDQDYEPYMELLRTVTDLPVKYVVNTHMHGDHSGGNIRLEAAGADIIATENVRKRLAATQQMGLPVMTFDDHMRLYFGRWAMDLYYFGRGHTDGDLVMHIADERLVLPGDLFAGYGPSLRLIDYNGGGSIMEWSGTLEKVMQLDFNTVIPGHSATTDRATMQGYLDETYQLQRMIREMHGAGRSPEDITEALTNEFGRMAVFFLPNVQAVIDELE